MNSSYTDIETTIQRYVLGELSERETEEFEEYFLAHPEVAEQVELSQQIRFGFLENPGVAETRGAGKHRGSNKFISSVLRWISFPVPAYAFALIGAAFVPVISSVQMSAEHDRYEFAQFSTLSTRGSEKYWGAESLVLEMGESTKPLELFLKVKPNVMESYYLEVQSLEGSFSRWKSETFSVNSQRQKVVVVPKKFARGKISIQLYGGRAGTQFQRVDFCHYSEVCN